MGLLDRLKAGHDSVPRWARIRHVGAQVGPVVSIELEVHYGDTPPQLVSTFAIPPRGVTLEVGQDWTVRAELSTGNAADYTIEFDEPVRYGSSAPSPGPDWPSPATPPRQAVHPVQRIVEARQALDEGRLTREEFDQARQVLMNWRTGR